MARTVYPRSNMSLHGLKGILKPHLGNVFTLKIAERLECHICFSMFSSRILYYYHEAHDLYILPRVPQQSSCYSKAPALRSNASRYVFGSANDDPLSKPMGELQTFLASLFGPHEKIWPS